jgi:A1 cistron-splicing factor AAR2
MAGVRGFEFDSGLAPYPLHLYHQWQQLSGHMTQQLIDRLNPVGGEGETGGRGWVDVGGKGCRGEDMGGEGGRGKEEGEEAT